MSHVQCVTYKIIATCIECATALQGNNMCVHKQVKVCLAIHDLSLAPPLRGKFFKEALRYRKTFDLNTSENV